MARPVFGRVSAAEEAGRSRVTHLDRDRSLVEAARRDPAAFEPLYRRYLAQVYSYAYYELGDHHDAEDATERTFLLALTHPAEEGRPADSAGVDVPGLAVPYRPQRRRDQRRSRRRRPEALRAATSAILDIERRRRAGRRRRGVAAVRRLPADRRRARAPLRRRMSTAEIAGVLGWRRRARPHRALRTVACDSAVRA
jgi:RNA polymerase sigma-70 factor (ECF subfamily)